MGNKPPVAEATETATETSIFTLSRNFLFIFLARVIDMAGQFAPMFLMPRYLGASLYGDYGFALAFALIPISFTYLGLDRIVTREIARNKEAAAAYLGAALQARWLYMGLSLPLVVAAVYLLHLSSQIIIGIALALLAYNFMGDAFLHLAMFRAFERMRLETLLTAVYQSLNIASVLIVIFFDLGFFGFFWSLSLAHFCRLVLASLCARKYFVKPKLRPQKRLIIFFIKETYIFGTFILLNQLLINVELLLLQFFQNSYAVSMFYAPHTLMLATSIFPNAFLAAIYPRLARAAVGDQQSLRLIYEKCFRLLLFFGFLVFIPLFGWAETIIPFVFGPEFLPAVEVFRILCAGLVFVMLSFAFDYPLSAINRQNSLIYCSLGALGVKVLLSLLLIPSYGYVGAGLSAALGYLVFFGIGFAMAARHIAGLPLLRLLLQPGLVAGVLVLGLAQVGGGSFPVLAGSLLVYCASLWWWRFFADDEIMFVKSLWEKIRSFQKTG